MSETVHDTGTEHKPAHGTLMSYVVGFVLSLVFTLIPYYLVVNKTIKGDALLATILGFAFVQLIIQVVFFLHLGREKKPRFQLYFLIITVIAIVAVVGGSIWIMNHLHYNMTGKQVTDKIVDDEAVYQIGGEQIGTCTGNTGTQYKIVLKNDAASPSRIDAKLCDTILIVNLDDSAHEISFGEYGKPGTYAGEAGKSIRPGRNMAFRLTEAGTYKFHDTRQSEISGEFTVKE